MKKTIHSLKCSDCGANITIDENKKTVHCEYCGKKIIIKSQETTYIHKQIDETKIKEAELSASLRIKELEIEEKKRVSKQRANFVKTIISIFLGAFGLLMMMAGSEGMTIGMLAIIIIAYMWIFSDIIK